MSATKFHCVIEADDHVAVRTATPGATCVRSNGVDYSSEVKQPAVVIEAREGEEKALIHLAYDDAAALATHILGLVAGNASNEAQ